MVTIRIEKKLFCILVFLALIGCNSQTGSDDVQLSNTVEPSFTPTNISISEPSQTSISLTPTLAFSNGSSITSNRDGAVLVYVPGGRFVMGSDEEHCGECGNDSPSYQDNHPQHSLFLDAYWIDQTEVTNKQYALCVSDEVCAPPLDSKSPMRSSYYGNPEFDNYPVIFIEWDMALTYCEWANRRLPTEAEWEKAARGMDGNIYPWGNEAPDDYVLNYNSPIRDTTDVGKYLDGASLYGVLDMAGNVWEWTSSLVYPYPYSPTDGRENLLVNEYRVLRGGSWYFQQDSLRSIFRFGVVPVEFLVRSDTRSWSVPIYAETSIYGKPPFGFGTVGIRCAMDAE